MKKNIAWEPLSNNGFTLIEVICAIAILTVGILSLYSLQISSINTNSSANTITAASTWASDRVEILINRPYSCNPFSTNCHDLDDTNGNGTGQDTNFDGRDDVGPDFNFGLNDATTATADHSVTSPDGRYTILWNVAVDTPLPNTKTIRVIVTSSDRGVIKSVPLTYIKSDKI